MSALAAALFPPLPEGAKKQMGTQGQTCLILENIFTGMKTTG